tara:strand:+ start:148 stop:465 length:318 start_codon:yes stop_codon:yes gene_type:complete
MSQMTELKDGLEELEEDFGTTFNWHGVDYPCIPAVESRDSEYDSFAGGISRRDSSALIVRSDCLVNGFPVVRDMITYNGRSYRIDEIVRAPTNLFFVFQLIDPNE